MARRVSTAGDRSARPQAKFVRLVRLMRYLDRMTAPLTWDGLAAVFQVSKRTIYRDVAVFRAAGARLAVEYDEVGRAQVRGIRYWDDGDD